MPDGPVAPPQNLEAEQSVLGAVLLSDTALPALIIDERLHPEDFYREAHGIVFAAMLELHNGGEPVDALTLVEHLKQAGKLEAAGGRAAIDLLPPASRGRPRPPVRADRARERDAAPAAARGLRDPGPRPRPRRAAARARRHRRALDPRGRARGLPQGLPRDQRRPDVEIDKLEELSREGKAITGTPSGFEDLDTITGGFQPGNLIILAARPSMGKSALMANFAENAALEANKAVALFSLEMSESELAQRFIASQASIKGDDLRKGKVPASRWGKIMEASNRLAKSPLFIDDSSDLSVLDVRAKARRLLQQHADGLGLILIDYLQLMRGDGRTDNRVEQIGQISRGLKTLARELDCPVIALSQLNRGVEQRTDKRPVLSDLRESGSIEQDADLVMFIYRDEYYDHESEREGIADVIISKHRNGGLGDGRAHVPEGVPAVHVLRRRRPLLVPAMALPRRTLRRLRLPLRRGRPAGAAVLVPARADRAQEGRRARGADPAALPRGVVRPRAADLDRAREPARRARGAPVRAHDRRAARRRPRRLVHRRRRHREDDARDAHLEGGDGGRPHRRDLLAARACSPAARHLPRRRPLLAQRADRPAERGRPAAHRRRRRRADLALGARAALHDRQHALRGRPARSC